MSLSPAFLDELRHRTTLSTLIGKTTKLQKAGREYRACCPFHNEKSPSFYVNDDKGFYHCFGCGAHGDAIRWMTDNRGLPFIDAVKELAQTAGLEMPAMDRRAAEKAERAKGLTEAMGDAAAWFTTQLQGIAGAEARAVLEKRGVRAETAAAFGLGFAPDSRGKLKDSLKDYGDPMLVEAGLLISVDGKAPYDRFRGRLMIPIRDPRGRTIAFGGRIVGEGEPKYLNSPETPLFDKGRTLYNLDRALPAARKSGRIVAVEGYMDVIALAQAGFDEVVAPLGTALTEHQLDRLWTMAEVPILCFDGDAAGQKAAMRAAARALPMLAPGRSLAFATLPEGVDPDDLVRTQGAAAFERVLADAEPLVERIWRHELAAGGEMRTPEERAALGSRLRAHAKEIADEHLRSEYLATFNRMVWDYFHPERPSESFRRFKGDDKTIRPVNPRMQAIAQFGVDQTTLVPALFHGLLRYPELIAPLAETIDGVLVNHQALRQIRQAMFGAALTNPALETADLKAILKAEGLSNVVQRLEGVTLAFSFLVTQGDAHVAKRDLASVAERLSSGPQIDSQLAEARARSGEWTEADYETYIGLVRVRERIEQAFRDTQLDDVAV